MTEAPDTKLRLAVMCNALTLKKWQAECVKKLTDSGIIKPVLIIINNNKDCKKSFLSKISAYPYKNFCYRIYVRFFLKSGMQKEQALPEALVNADRISCNVNTIGFSEYFSDPDIEKIQSYKPDFILRFGFNIIRGNILHSAKYGIWSFHHDDELKYRGGPFGFWEIYRNDRVNAVILQRLTERLDSGIILKKYFLKTILHSYTANVDSLLHHCTIMPLQVCTDITNNLIQESPMNASQTMAPIYKTPSNCQMLMFLLKQKSNLFKFHFNELFRSESWQIGITKSPLQEVALRSRKYEFQWLPNEKASIFRADPFVYENKGKTAIIYEKYDYKIKKGSICRSYLNSDNSFSKEQIILDGSKHRAYPFIFQESNEIYCIPEESELNRIALYKLNTSTDEFEYFKILINAIDAVDASLIKYQEKWWLFFTCKSTDTNTKLHIYHAEKIEGPYFPHKNNPVKCDIRSARPAGNLFINEGNLYRPAQDSARLYGSRIRINQVTKLSEKEFEETEVSEITPQSLNKKFTGTHTISGFGDYTVIDAKRYHFVFHAFKNQFKSKFHNLFKAKKQYF